MSNPSKADTETTPDCVPTDSVSMRSYHAASAGLHPAILNHSLRVYLYAKALAEREASTWALPDNLPLLFAACIYHDMGTCCTTDNDPQRFEVTGADAAAQMLRSQNVAEADVHEVWVAIALHTSPHIAERISSLARLVRVAVLLDFGRPPAAIPADITTEVNVQATEQMFPRMAIERILGDAVVGQALRRPEKAPMVSWPGVMLKAKLQDPEWEGVNKAF
ncbi:hypothetical protein LTR08_005836 [Meristemomyces frigidus]|nr:hypothetical protein LTR08_005836 [Meristemomyces frigidus]